MNNERPLKVAGTRSHQSQPMNLDIAGFLIGTGAVTTLAGIVLIAEYRDAPGKEGIGLLTSTGGLMAMIAGLGIIAEDAVGRLV